MKILYKNLSDADKKIINDNKIYEQFPSGTYFQGFKSSYVILTDETMVSCHYDAVYENGIGCGGTFKYRKVINC